MAKRWGATPEEWAHFKRLAKVDLLPVVSNPHAEISPRSKMKGKGKTPSLYNHQDQVRGFPDWTDFEANLKNIDAWSAEEDYGLCVQTRRIRALDIDVPDEALSDAIRRDWLDELNLTDAPTRSRADSGKQLLPFIFEGELSKRSFVVKEWVDEDTGKKKRWIVELLATGQQFVAAGTHSEGARYEWSPALPAKLPVLDVRALEKAWDALVARYAIEGVDRRAERRDPTLLEDLDVADPVAEHLVESGWPTYGYEKGMLYIDCPWKDGHSSDNGETETAWLLAGTGKYRNGHFRCMHAGCAEHGDAEFLKVVGYRPAKASDFEDLSEDDGGAELYAKLAPGASPKSKELKAQAKLPLPGFLRDNGGRIETCLENLYRALRAPQAAECEVAFDDFRGELMIAETPGAWRSFNDADAVRLRIRLEALGFKDKIGKELMRDALELVGDEHHFDSAILWLTEVVPEWDGVSRVRTFWPTYMGTKDTAYTRALGDYSWTAQAGRILSPGCQVDMVPVLVGPEGLRKSTAIAQLAPSVEFFSEFSLAEDDKELARKMRGTLVGELAELRGIAARDGEAVLAWITRREEKWTPKFKEYATSLARRLVFYGTTNDNEFLQTHMGKRRWLPVDVLAMIDTDAIARDRLQLWAEARDLWLAEGALWAEVERLAKSELPAFRHVDPWFNRVGKWLDDNSGIDDSETPRSCGHLRSEQVLQECCGLDPAKIKKADQQRIAEVLKDLGMVRIQRKIDGRNVKVWIDASAEEIA